MLRACRPVDEQLSHLQVYVQVCLLRSKLQQLRPVAGVWHNPTCVAGTQGLDCGAHVNGSALPVDIGSTQPVLRPA